MGEVLLGRFNVRFKASQVLKACVRGCPHKQTQTRSEHMRCLSVFLRLASCSPSGFSLLASVSWTQTQTHPHAHANPAIYTLAVIPLALRGTPASFWEPWHSSDRYYSWSSHLRPMMHHWRDATGSGCLQYRDTSPKMWNQDQNKCSGCRLN